MRIEFFETAADFRSWLRANHGKARELAVGFCKKKSGRPTVTYSEAVDEALCFGWIDGVRTASTPILIEFASLRESPEADGAR